ncbi:MAG: mandelate racemase/muconate lactonizing enzyme family protein [Deltaproteobacteria bacterium]|nr:mandelate racemase/muconate lactonizing enzyme family protein [Deltaproteobacteria bacterium]
MKIEKIETKLFKDDVLPQLFVHITTEDGLVGVGEAWWGLSVKPVESAINDALAPLLIGEDSTRIEQLWQKMFKYAYRYGTEGVILCGLSGIDLALWDLLGKKLDVPVVLLLGGKVRDSLKAYASFPPYRKEEIVRREVERSVKLSFAGVKLHEYDMELVATARDTAPDGYPIMVDVNGYWTPLEAEENARRLADLGVLWLEEPIWPMQDYEAMAKLRQRVDLKLAAGENEYSLKAFDTLMKSGAVDYVQPEITKIGGLSMARKVSALADLHNVAICPHSFRIGPAAYANIHWAFSQMNMEWIEIPLLPEGRTFPSNTPPLDMIDGQIQFPKGSGFGLLEL